jgi:hypothetical protein
MRISAKQAVLAAIVAGLGVGATVAHAATPGIDPNGTVAYLVVRACAGAMATGPRQTQSLSAMARPRVLRLAQRSLWLPTRCSPSTRLT